MSNRVIEDLEDRRDPITGAPDSHPIETGMGAATFGTLGALAGAVAGPIGAMVGGAVGAAAGGALGHKVGEQHEEEEAYGRVAAELQQDFASRDYPQGAPYDFFEPAYRFGAASYHAYPEKVWNDEGLQLELRKKWEDVEHDPSLTFERAQGAIRDAWYAAERISQRQG